MSEEIDYTKEEKWLKSLERVLKKQPDTVVVIVYANGHVNMCEKKAFQDRMSGADGHMDSFGAGDLCDLDYIDGCSSKLEPYGESV